MYLKEVSTIIIVNHFTKENMPVTFSTSLSFPKPIRKANSLRDLGEHNVTQMFGSTC